MLVNGKPYRTVWLEGTNPPRVRIIDQRYLPFRFVVETLEDVASTAIAIKEMHVRGAGCIGATAGFGMYLAALEAIRHSDPLQALRGFAEQLKTTRPTAVNLAWAVDRQFQVLEKAGSPDGWVAIALETARNIADEDAHSCQEIGRHGLPLIQEVASRKCAGAPVNILTHCNAGWLAFVDYGSATSPIYAAHDAGIPVHVWVDETRPRNQGARLTAWELASHGVSHTVISDNAGGHLMQHGQVDLVITGTDRTTYTGDVANKIGTYLKALAAMDNGVPFYVALPSSTFDWEIADGIHGIPIEERPAKEVTHVSGLVSGACGEDETTLQILPSGSAASNPAFDVTPARLVTGLITERGICTATEEGIARLFPGFRECSSHSALQLATPKT